MQCQILLVIHKWIQGNVEGESGNLSEVTLGFSPGTPAIETAIFSICLSQWMSMVWWYVCPQRELVIYYLVPPYCILQKWLLARHDLHSTVMCLAISIALYRNCLVHSEEETACKFSGLRLWCKPNSWSIVWSRYRNRFQFSIISVCITSMKTQKCFWQELVSLNWWFVLEESLCSPNTEL